MRAALRLLPLAMSLAACGREPPASWLTYPGVEGHAQYLPLVGTSHDPSTHPSVTCEGCHPGSTFREPVCTSCHAQGATVALHTSAATGQVLPGFAWTPPTTGAGWRRSGCLDCHPQGGVPDFAHDAFFPVGAGTAHDRSCASCHADPLDKKNPARLLCVSCHSGPGVGAPLPGPHATLLRADAYPAVPTALDCLRCHDRGEVLRVADHGARRGPEGFGRAGPWDGDAAACTTGGDDCRHGERGSRVNCFACHDARPPAFGGKGAGVASRPWAQDWKIPATTAGQTAATACRGCHGPQ